MTNKKPKHPKRRSRAELRKAAVARWLTAARTPIRLLWRSTRLDGANAPVLWGAVAETIRARLDPIDADIVAGFFDRLARGDDPRVVFQTDKGGHRRKTEGDPLDIAWRVHFAKHAHIDEQIAFKRIAKAEGLKVDTVRRYYDKHRVEIESLHPLADPNDTPTSSDSQNRGR